MFNTFSSTFRRDCEKSCDIEIKSSTMPVEDKHSTFLSLFGGASFNHGIYRTIALNEVDYWNELIENIFPFFSKRINCFSVDWLGRVFAVDSARLIDQNPGVIMIQPGTAQILDIPCNIESFHENELIKYREEALAENFFKQWIANGGVSPNLLQCIGYRKPLFLGGADTIDNLELSDLDVYWTIASQLIRKTKNLPIGTVIGKVTI